MTLGELVTSLSANPYFGAGFGLFGVGAVAAIARRGAQVDAFYFFVRKKCYPVYQRKQRFRLNLHEERGICLGHF
jgi:hypothetical protein